MSGAEAVKAMSDPPSALPFHPAPTIPWLSSSVSSSEVSELNSCSREVQR